MPKFTMNRIYSLNEIKRSSFESRFVDNREFSRWLGRDNLFRAHVVIDGDIHSVERLSDGERFQIDIIWGTESTYINERVDLGWYEGNCYQLKDLESIKSYSSINRRFLENVGFNPFKVIAVDDRNISNGFRTSKIEYIDKEGNVAQMGHSFLEKERKYFESWGGGFLIKGFARGEQAINLSTVNKPLRGPTPAQIALEQMEADIKASFKEPALLTVSGTINCVVDDEVSRLAVIKALEGIRFADV